MKILAAVALALPVCAALGGCDNQGTLLGPNGGSRYSIDSSGLGDAQLLAAYSGALAVGGGYDGDPQWTLVSGELPAGLGLAPDGRITGTPTWVGPSSFSVRVTGEGLGTLSDDLELEVVVGGAPVGLGFTRDQTTSLTEDLGLMWDMWLRLAGTGVDGTTYTFDPGLYHAGPDEILRGGQGDDVRVGDVSISELEVDVGSWQAVDDADDDPLEYLGDGTFLAGSDTGEASVRLEHPEYGSVDTRVLVTAPDWCPEGEHDGGGPNNPGFCA